MLQRKILEVKLVVANIRVVIKMEVEKTEVMLVMIEDYKKKFNQNQLKKRKLLY